MKNNGKLIPEKIGVNQASTFKGFCSTHDKAIFSCIEDHPFIGNQEQCLVLMYRSVIKELYAKEGGLNISEFIKGGDKGRNKSTQIFIQNFASAHQSGIEAAIAELSTIKSKLDLHLFGDTKQTFNHVILESSNPIPVVVSSIVLPSIDFLGNKIQDLGDFNVEPEYLIFNSLSSAGSGFIVLSWECESEKISNFVNTILSGEMSDIFNKLVRFFFCMAENTFLSPVWWDTLTHKQKNRINDLIMSGANPFSTQKDVTYVDNDIVFSGWNVERISRV